MEELPFYPIPSQRRNYQGVEANDHQTSSGDDHPAISQYFHLDWRIVCGKRYLKHKFRPIKLKHVKIIGIDEIAIGHTESGKTAYWTIVHDMDSGALLPVDPEKDGDALRDFLLLMRSI